MAFRDLGMSVPVVVRLRGTNEEIGQRMVSTGFTGLYHVVSRNCGHGCFFFFLFSC